MFLKNTRVKQRDSRRVRPYCLYSCVILLLSPLVLIGGLQAQDSKVNNLASNPEHANATQVAALPKPEDYVIGPDDLLNVYVLDVPELSRDYRVSAAGTIAIPVLATPLDAAGLTLERFSDLLAKELKTQGLVSDPHITMAVDQSRLHSIAIVGAVRRPQVYPVLTRTTLLDILSQAEGLADDAGNTVIVHHGDIGTRAQSRNGSAPGSPEQLQGDTLTIDLRRLIEGADPSLNVNIYPGDRITVPRAGVIYVVGAVNKPGGFAMKASSHGMTVLQVLALAEDTKSTAKRDQTVIIRNDSQAPEGRKQIPIDLKSILRGKSADPVLQAEDILFVPDSGGRRALNRGIESVVQAATGVAIYGARF
jgi:polysaccharide export outer membrane protein